MKMKMATAALLPVMVATLLASAPTQAAPVNWSGFAIGAGVGGSFGATTGQNVTATSFFLLGRPDPVGEIGSLGLSWNYQFSNGLVLGAVGDFGLLSGSDTLTNPAAGWSLKVRNDWLGTLRGKFGYAVGPALFYTTGGLAWARTDATFIPATPFPFPGATTTVTRSTVVPGWTLGAGADVALAQHISFEAEYLYVHVNSLSFAIPQLFRPPGHAQFAEDMSVFRLGINYRF
ncbi:MAG: outer membrane beta-barrel protein [Hyphomicrobiales bacterium]|nr:outer membrane beta-barrel protein [Hyphomicrobiales bacterium]